MCVKNIFIVKKKNYKMVKLCEVDFQFFMPCNVGFNQSQEHRYCMVQKVVSQLLTAIAPPF